MCFKMSWLCAITYVFHVSHSSFNPIFSSSCVISSLFSPPLLFFVLHRFWAHLVIQESIMKQQPFDCLKCTPPFSSLPPHLSLLPLSLSPVYRRPLYTFILFNFSLFCNGPVNCSFTAVSLVSGRQIKCKFRWKKNKTKGGKKTSFTFNFKFK